MPYFAPFQENPLKTKADFQQLVNDLIEPLVPYLNKQGAKLDFDEGGAIFDMKASSLEGIARPLWGIIPLVVGGGEFKHWALFRRALIEGTDPNHANYWGQTTNINQRSVEMAAIGLLLALTPEHGWDPLSAEQQENLAKWIAHIQQCAVPQNNWLFFTILVQAGLRRVGRADLVNTDVEKHYLDKLKNFYLGEGWYGDGDVKNIDHYGGFALHFYGMIYATLLEDTDPELCQLFLQRANEFVEPFSYWFSDHGDTLAQGRSLCYRFATSGFWAMAGIANCDAKPLGEIKGLWARQIRLWKEHPIFTTEGIMTRGYYYPNLVVAEGYNSPTSPYWAMKAFFPLLLADDAEFWTTEERPLSITNNIYPMPSASSLAQRVNGHSIVHFAGTIEPQFQVDKYNKFAYSTCFGLDVNALQHGHMGSFGDNILAFSFDAGTNWQTRMHNNEVSVETSSMLVDWSTGEQAVKTTIEIGDNGTFTRTHEFTLARPAWIVESGFAISNWYKEQQIIEKVDGKQAVVTLAGSNGLSQITSLDNYEKKAMCCCRIHSNVVSPRTHVPYLLTKLPAGTHKVVSQFMVTPTE